MTAGERAVAFPRWKLRVTSTCGLDIRSVPRRRSQEIAVPENPASLTEDTPASFAERLGVPPKRGPNDKYMKSDEGPEMNAAEASATLKDKLDIDIAPDVIARLADQRKVLHRRATNFAGEPLGPPSFTLGDLEDLAERLARDPHLTDPAPAVASGALTESRPAGRGYRPARGSFAYDGPVERDEEDAHPGAVTNSHTARFRGERCTTERFPKSGAAARVRAARLYEALTEWWNTEELPPGELPTRNAFGRYLTRSGFPLSQEWDNRLRESANYRLGLRLKLKAELAADDDRQAVSKPAGTPQPAEGATTRRRRSAEPVTAHEQPAGGAISDQPAQETAPKRRAAK